MQLSRAADAGELQYYLLKWRHYQPRSVTIFNGGGLALNQEGPQDSVKFSKFEGVGFENSREGRIREFERGVGFENEFEGGGG